MRIFGDPTRMKALMTRVGMKAGEAIESGMLTRQIERAQRRVEQHNFDARKQLLEYDDVANDQRRVIYQQRTDLMGAEDVAEAVKGIREDVVAQLVDQYVPARRARGAMGCARAGAGDRAGFRPALPIEEWVKAEEAGDGSRAARQDRRGAGGGLRPEGSQRRRAGHALHREGSDAAHARSALARASGRHGLHAAGHFPAQLRAEESRSRNTSARRSSCSRRCSIASSSTPSPRSRRSRCAARRRSSAKNSSGSSAWRARCKLQHAEAVSPIQTVPGSDAQARRPRRRRRRQCHGDGAARDAPGGRAVRAGRAQGGPQRALSLRLGTKYKHCHGTLQQASG